MDTKALVRELLTYWFGSIDDQTPLDREAEPFATHYGRWYGKDPRIDEEIRARFEPALESITSDAAVWRRIEREVEDDPAASLAVTLLLDQLPRNMYRGTARMYAHDSLALAHAFGSLRAGHDRELSLLERMFAYMPLMHAEDVTLQRVMEAHFEELAAAAANRCQHNRAFYEFALECARRHREVVERFGRFPHRNAILDRQSTAAEVHALRGEDLAF